MGPRQDLEVSVSKTRLCCDGPTNITACFIDTDCSDTSKSGPINLQAADGVTGTCEGATAANVCLSSCGGGLDGPEPQRHSLQGDNVPVFVLYVEGHFKTGCEQITCDVVLKI